jgi:formylglycine-generating enzyme required for sulfatase activity
MKTCIQRTFSPWVIALIVVAGFILSGCSDANEVTENDNDGITGVTLDKKEIYLPVDESETITATVQLAKDADTTVTWSSSKTAVATVSGGTVTGVADGITIVTVSTKNGRTAKCLVIVGDAVVSVTLNKSTLILGMGRTETLIATVQPKDAVSISVTWSSDNPTVASVSGGTVCALAVGTATIFVTTAEGGKRASCDVTVAPLIKGMVWISPGTFIMGSPLTEPKSWNSEDPHQVTLTKGFYMGETEVTQGRYLELMGYNPSYFNYYGDEDNWDDYPVDSVSWYDALEFCNKLSEMEGLTPAYTITDRDPPTGYPIEYAKVGVDWDASGYRLPTEAEWEYACRAGTTTPFNFFNEASGGWGTDTLSSGLDGQANFNGELLPYNGSPEGDYLGYTTPVGCYAPNAWGLYDMHGNLYEWCWDFYGSYRETATGAQTETDPKGPLSSEYGERVLRGGSFASPGEELRSAYRENYDDPYPSFNYPMTIGFRVVLPYSVSR